MNPCLHSLSAAHRPAGNAPPPQVGVRIAATGRTRRTARIDVEPTHPIIATITARRTAMDRQVVSSWLQSVLTPYVDSARAYSDIMTTLDSLPSLSPRTELYISNVGESSLLVQLKGTVPIQFKRNTYNIPLEVWVPKAYPRQAPMCYVTPTREMNVRKTDEVELDGWVSGGEYGRRWERKWEVSRGDGKQQIRCLIMWWLIDAYEPCCSNPSFPGRPNHSSHSSNHVRKHLRDSRPSMPSPRALSP